jgi:hypothetical protein
MTSTTTTMSSTSTGITLNETGTVVYETIGTTGTYILIAEGGAGAAGYGGQGGYGGIVTGTFSLTAGTKLEIVVGGGGSASGDGGGGSFIYDENTGILLEAAGGGGGGGGFYAGNAASATTAGSNGNGTYGGSSGTNGNGGSAGTYSHNIYRYVYGFNGGGGGGIRSNGGRSNTMDSGQAGSGGNLPGAKNPTTGVSVTLPGLGGGGGGGYHGYSGGGGGGGGYGGGGGGSFLATSPTNPTDLSATLSSAHFTATNTGNGKVIIAATACFAEGTRILTADGRLVAVERLAAGDAVEIFDGTASKIIWVGRRRIDLTLHPRPDTARPIRIAAGALGGGLPWRDLVVSPDHGMYLNGHLIPAKILLNGGNIRQLDVPQVTYYHIELAQHAVLFAEGAAAESYLETGNRHAFENEAVTMMHPDFAQTKREVESCAPFVESGAVVEAVRQQILDPANIQTNFELELDIQIREGAAHIISRSAIPGQLQADPRDQRRLGVKIAAISIGGEPLNLSHELLTQGWHDVEHDGRWTDGHAVIPAALVLGGAVTVQLIAATRYRESSNKAA